MLGTLIGKVRDVLGIGVRLRIDPGVEPTPHLLVLIDGPDSVPAIRVRYDAGRSLPENGQELARLMTELVALWPVEVERISLIGRTAGGLLAQHAVRSPQAATWSGRVVRVICFARSSRLHMWSLRAPHLPSESAAETRIACLDERDWLRIHPSRMLTHPIPPPVRGSVPSTRPAHWIDTLLVTSSNTSRLGRVTRWVGRRRGGGLVVRGPG